MSELHRTPFAASFSVAAVASRKVCFILLLVMSMLVTEAMPIDVPPCLLITGREHRSEARST